MEGMLTFIGWVIIIFGILQIILFFKVWIMTNNVAKISKKMGCGNNKLHSVRATLLTEGADAAKKILLKSIVDDLMNFSENGINSGYDSYNQIIEHYSPVFKYLEMEIPQDIKNFNVRSSVWK